MKSCYKIIIFSCLYLFVLISCRPNGYAPAQIIEYNPQKAGAEIVNQILYEKVNYINYQNNCYYSIKNEKDKDIISFFDITNDLIRKKRELIITNNQCLNSDCIYLKAKSVNYIREQLVLFADVRKAILKRLLVH